MIPWIPLLTAFGLGAAHALEPGHGKTLVAAYLTGTRGRVTDAFILGGLVTFFHTLSVFLIGLLVILIAHGIDQGDWIRSMNVISGLLVLGIGVMLFWRRFVQDKAASECECHILHSHPPGHAEPEQPASSLKEVVTLGVASGIAPCPIAISALITSVSMGGFGRLPEALLFLVVFSLGLSSVLTVLGAALVLSRGRLMPIFFTRQSRLPVMISKLSALLIMLLGVYLIVQGFVAEPHQESGPGLMLSHTVETAL